MDRIGEEAATKFINALIKSVQTLCHGYLDFETGVEIIGHINLSVDRGNSLDYILKEKVCKNAENSTMFVSDSFYAEPRPEQIVTRNSSLSDFQDMQHGESPDLGESGRMSSAISSISSSLSASRGRRRRGSSLSQSLRALHRPVKQKPFLDLKGEVLPAKVPRVSASASYHGSDGVGTLLPQTASLTDHSEVGVNFGGNMLAPMGSQERDVDSEDELEVRFVKEEYTEKERSSCDFDNSTGHQSSGGTHDRGQSSTSSSITYSSGLVDRGTGTSGYSGLDSQVGPSGMRGVQGFVHSLSAFGSVGATGLPLGQFCGGRGGNRGGSNSPGFSSKSHSSLQRAFALHSEEKRRREAGERNEEIKKRLELMSELLALKGVTNPDEYKVALQREKRRMAKKMYRASLPEEKRIEIKEKDKLHKRLKRASRWAATASLTDSSGPFPHDSVEMGGKDYESGQPHSSPGSVGSYAGMSSEYVGDVPNKEEGSVGNASRMTSESAMGNASRMDSSAIGSASRMSTETAMGHPSQIGSDSSGIGNATNMGTDSRMDSSAMGNTTRMGSSDTSAIGSASQAMGSDPSAMVPSRGSSDSAPDGRAHGFSPEPVGCYAGLGSGSIPRLGPSTLGSIPRLGLPSLTTFPRMGSDTMEGYPSLGPTSVSTSGMGFGSAQSVSWMDSMAFGSAQDQRRMDSAPSPRDSQNHMKLGDR